MRIIVAEVVSQLVSRSGDNLTPEDRNWITSVASRQKGRDPRKPTLMLLLDFAFPLFDLAAFCRFPHATVPSSDTTKPLPSAAAGPDTSPVTAIYSRLLIIVKNASTSSQLHYLQSPSTEPGNPSNLSSTIVVDSVVLKVLHLIDTSQNICDENNSTDSVQHVAEAIEKLLKCMDASTWNAPAASMPHLHTRALTTAAKAFAHALPLRRNRYALSLTDSQLLSAWLYDSTDCLYWHAWAQLANDASYISKVTDAADLGTRTRLCECILTELFAESSEIEGRQKSIPQLRGEEKVELHHPPLSAVREHHLDHTTVSNASLTLRLIVDIAINLERFLSFFVETYDNDSAEAGDIKWTAISYENILPGLSLWRNALLSNGNVLRDAEMIKWSARSVIIARFYESTVSGPVNIMRDLNGAIQSAFAEASWSAETRTMRYMLPAGEQGIASKAEELGIDCRGHALQPWVCGLDLSKALHVAITIVIWDPRRALRLIDEAIGLTDEVRRKVCDGNVGLPIWDFRRIGVCTLLTRRGSLSQTILGMERLQPLFNMKGAHEGGRFSTESVVVLRAGTKEGNFCAQTALGLLFAGTGEYWDVARRWAQCERRMAEGMKLLYASAVTGDAEASAGLCHVLTQHSFADVDRAWLDLSFDQIVSLFKSAVLSQNSNAVLNLGVVWMYGIDGAMDANEKMAVDCILMALQGAVSSQARCVAVEHMLEYIGDSRKDLVSLLRNVRDYSSRLSD